MVRGKKRIKDLALALAWELDDEELVEFIKFYKKELTKDEKPRGGLDIGSCFC